MKTVLIFYLVIVIVVNIAIILKYGISGYDITPVGIYNTSNMNAFGCILVSGLLIISIPLVALLQFLYWITHVGRKD